MKISTYKSEFNIIKFSASLVKEYPYLFGYVDAGIRGDGKGAISFLDSKQTKICDWPAFFCTGEWKRIMAGDRFIFEYGQFILVKEDNFMTNYKFIK